MKRITSLILVTLLVVSLFAFVGCERVDEEYCLTAQTALQNYAESKGKDSYSAENWSLITSKIVQSNQAIEKAKDNAEVDKIVEETKQEIDSIEYKPGEVYMLSGEIQKKIKEEYLSKILTDFSDAKIDEITIERYLGYYDYAKLEDGGFGDEDYLGVLTVVLISEPYSDYPAEKIDSWDYKEHQRVFVWDENSLMMLINVVWDKYAFDSSGVHSVYDKDIDVKTYMDMRAAMTKNSSVFNKVSSGAKGFFGKYNGAVVYNQLTTVWATNSSETVEEIRFEFSGLTRIHIYKDGVIYVSLTSAYEAGVLTKDDLVAIKETHVSRYPELYERYE